MTEKTKDMEPLLTDVQVAGVLGVTLATLAAWRCSGRVQGLHFIKAGKAVRYRRADVERFIEANSTQPGA